MSKRGLAAVNRDLPCLRFWLISVARAIEKLVEMAHAPVLGRSFENKVTIIPKPAQKYNGSADARA